VFFDDFTIIHERSTYSLRVVESIDYDPFGVVLEGTHYVDISRPLNSYLYQGEFAEFEKLTGWSRFAGRSNYDALVGRWFSLDPQNQFPSPYLAMGNNPVMIVDPDGEWAFFAAALGKIFTKKAISVGLKTGLINAISNFDEKKGLGWHTLGDFAAGYLGGATGVGFGSKILGMGVGGFTTWAVNGADFNYQGAQEFVGGALSTYVGMGKAVKGKHTIFKESKNTLISFKKKNVLTNTLIKHGDNFIKYGLQNMAFDFAYSKEKDFRSRGWRHVDLFVWGGLSNTFHGISWEKEIGFGQSLLYVGIDWAVNGAIKKGYHGVKVDGSQANKMVLGYLKWLEYLLTTY
jgi:RHS repeat-associated protein